MQHCLEQWKAKTIQIWWTVESVNARPAVDGSFGIALVACHSSMRVRLYAEADTCLGRWCCLVGLLRLKSSQVNHHHTRWFQRHRWNRSTWSWQVHTSTIHWQTYQGASEEMASLQAATAREGFTWWRTYGNQIFAHIDVVSMLDSLEHHTPCEDIKGLLLYNFEPRIDRDAPYRQTPLHHPNACYCG